MKISSSGPQTYRGGVFALDGDVEIVIGDRRVGADHIEYDRNTGELTLSGNVRLTSGGSGAGVNAERIAASHGSYNLKTATGTFYDVSGSVGLPASQRTRMASYTTDSPFLFTARMLTKTGRQNYELYDGTVTNCQLPHPDWSLSSAHISLEDGVARAHNSTFRLLHVPVLFFPYVTHPSSAEARTSGLLVPTLGYSNSKGFIIGEEVLLTLGRSADLRVGAAHYSNLTSGTPANRYADGWAENATFRYRGNGQDFALAHYSAVLDSRVKRYNQGGEEFRISGRHDLSPTTRAAANVDYLSSYIFREAFSDTFNQAVTSDIVSTAYLTHAANGLEAAVFADRYQGIKLIAQGETPQQQVHLFHAPVVVFNGTDHRVPRTASPLSAGLEFSFESSAAGLKRTQPNFETGGIIERIDVHPQFSYPLAAGGWHVLPALAARETVYTRSRQTGVPGPNPVQSESSLSRAALEFTLEIKAPVVARSFRPGHLTRLLGTELRHTVAPEITYKLADGISNFNKILRFDAVDVASNTDEVEYGVTQRIYRRTKAAATAAGTTADAPCRTADVAHAPGFTSDAPNGSDEMPGRLADAEDSAGRGGPCPSEELISWRLSQRYFFDQTFGGAVVNTRRNIFTTTLDLSGVAFVTEPRQISPLISRLRFRTSAHTDVEWDFDLDTSLKKFNSSNVYLDLHQGAAFAAVSYARLDAPGRFYTENPVQTPGLPASNGVTSSISDFNQLRLLLGYGDPARPGLSLAANTGIDLKNLYGTYNAVTTVTVYPPLLQYATVQASYNWNCCGLAIEYRKLELGSVRNDGTYRFNFTLANIGAAGNLRRAERLF